MITLADYIAIRRNSFTIQRGAPGTPDHRKFDFNLPSNFTAGTGDSRPVLSFIVRPESDNVRFACWVNPEGSQLLESTQEVDLRFSRAPKMDMSFWEVIDGRKFRQGAENSIFFQVWQGHVRVRAIILWFQRGIMI
jgi:hypothetical protein